jgi:hypothetical protein
MRSGNAARPVLAGRSAAAISDDLTMSTVPCCPALATNAPGAPWEKSQRSIM